MVIETLSYKINWRSFNKGCSFFVPCIDTAAAKDTVLRTTKRLKFDVVMRVEIQEGVKGLRVWRV